MWRRQMRPQANWWQRVRGWLRNPDGASWVIPGCIHPERARRLGTLCFDPRKPFVVWARWVWPLGRKRPKSW